MVKKIFILAILLLVLSSCRNEEEIFLDLDMTRRPYTGKELRTDGYYYSGYIHTNKMGTLMLFRNGVCMFTYFDLLLSGKNKQKVLYLFIHRNCSRLTHPGAWFSVSNCKSYKIHFF
jgi:hypothetical protein